jgi:type II secretory pathway predicted ATPase ExeA
MAIEIRSFESALDLNAAANELRDRTVMVVGAVGTGKTWLARQLVGKLVDDGSRSALASARQRSSAPTWVSRRSESPRVSR